MIVDMMMMMMMLMAVMVMMMMMMVIQIKKVITMITILVKVLMMMNDGDAVDEQIYDGEGNYNDHNNDQWSWCIYKTKLKQCFKSIIM